ncbi:hypothetical protein [Mesoplasma tabanidae]|uniref:Uncharacterized protein n=1 Tax=Mesoplasma tabanidae TaxID=219745 RepID=A0A2K8P4C4_9MOLU|nr:hypothetical protein [Mesoplasma tabanidae]ATZ21597.1 hypothetical protein MTABA_v1c03960 [Mesoplasma tabanidae]
MKKLETKTIYWGFPVCLLPILDLIPNSTSKAYENIKLNKKLILNVVPSQMWNKIEKIANFSASKTNVIKGKELVIDKIAKTNLKLVKSDFKIDYIENTTLYIEAFYEGELLKNGIANICLSVKNIYINESMINEEGFVDEDKFDVLIYQFRKYKKINNTELGKSFRYIPCK